MKVINYDIDKRADYELKRMAYKKVNNRFKIIDGVILVKNFYKIHNKKSKYAQKDEADEIIHTHASPMI